MSLVTVQRNQEAASSSNDDSNATNSSSSSKSLNSDEKQPATSAFNDLKAIYNSANSESAKKTLAYRKTIPRNKSSVNESNTNTSIDTTSNKSTTLVNPNSSSNAMGYKSGFFKRASLNLPDHATSSANSHKQINPKTDKHSLCIRLKSDEELPSNDKVSPPPSTTTTPPKHLPSKSNSFTSPRVKASFKSSTSSSNSSLNVDEQAPILALAPQTLTKHRYLHQPNHLIEKYFVVKDAALILPRRSSSSNLNKLANNINLVDGTTTSSNTSGSQTWVIHIY